MKKLLFAIPVLALALAGCVKDEPFVNPEPDPTPTPPTPSVDAKIVFNEFDCQNKKIELYNTGDSEVDMTGWILSKDGTEWEIPASRGKIAAKGFAVFTGKSDGTTDPTFGLSGTKGFLMVLKDKGVIVIYDFGITDRMAGNDAYTEWYQNEYLKRFPKPPRKEDKWTQDDLPKGFVMEKQTEYDMEYPFKLDAFVDFMLIQSNVNAQIECGKIAAEQVRVRYAATPLTSHIRPNRKHLREERLTLCTTTYSSSTLLLNTVLELIFLPVRVLRVL